VSHKDSKIHCTIKDDETWSQHSVTPLSAWGRYNNENWECSSRVLELVAENWPRVTSEKQHGAASNST